MIQTFKKYVCQSPRMKYVEFQIMFCFLFKFFVTMFFLFCLTMLAFFMQYSADSFLERLTIVKLLTMMLVSMFLFVNLLIRFQKIEPLSRTGLLKTTVIYLIFSLLFLIFDIMLLYFENKTFSNYMKVIWNTAKIDIYFILGYFYIKYSKRSHAYFNFYDQKTG